MSKYWDEENRSCLKVELIIMSQNLITLFLSLFGAFIFYTAEGQNMKQYKWENRIVIVATSNSENALFKSQLQVLENLAVEAQERKLILFQIIGDQYIVNTYDESNQDQNWQKIKGAVSNIDIKNLKAFEFILVGLDGGVKLRLTDVISKEELFRIIDRMPMRLNELRNKKEKGGN